MNPYSEEKHNNFVVRTFSQNLDENELKWHKDREDRVVVPMHETNWMFQRENQLPEKISKEIKIKANEWHRVIKGDGDLTVKIYKN